VTRTRTTSPSYDRFSASRARRTRCTEGAVDMDTRSIAVLALIIAVIVLLIILL